jgi:hypothetical protein
MRCKNGEWGGEYREGNSLRWSCTLLEESRPTKHRSRAAVQEECFECRIWKCIAGWMIESRQTHPYSSPALSGQPDAIEIMTSFEAGLTQEYTRRVHLRDESGRERRGRTNVPIAVAAIRKSGDDAASFRSDGLFIPGNPGICFSPSSFNALLRT